MDTEYMLQTGTDLASQQLHCLETLFDPYSTYALERTGVKAGQRCLDVGSGGGSVTRWLASRVGPAGRVVSVDIEPKYKIIQSGIDWRVHDMNEGVPEGGPYDVIHARTVLMHLKRREEILKELVDALRPGGWLVVGDLRGDLQPPVVSTPSPEEAELFQRVQDVMLGTIGTGGGISYTWPAEIHNHMTKAGLVNVESDQFSTVVAGGSPGCIFYRNFSLQLEQLLVTKYGFTDVEMKRFQELMLNPAFQIWNYPFCISRGQAPASA